MILIIGGDCQGKSKYARYLADKNDTGKLKGKIADGQKDPWNDAWEKPYLLNFHGFLRQVIEDGEDADGFTRRILEGRPEVITINEVGCGIVPLELTERVYRETVGHAGQMLAAHAKEVYRIICGIPMQIK